MNKVLPVSHPSLNGSPTTTPPLNRKGASGHPHGSPSAQRRMSELSTIPVGQVGRLKKSFGTPDEWPETPTPTSRRVSGATSMPEAASRRPSPQPVVFDTSMPIKRAEGYLAEMRGVPAKLFGALTEFVHKNVMRIYHSAEVPIGVKVLLDAEIRDVLRMAGGIYGTDINERLKMGDGLPDAATLCQTSSAELGVSLLKQNRDGAISWRGRQVSLPRWCLQMAREVVHPHILAKKKEFEERLAQDRPDGDRAELLKVKEAFDKKCDDLANKIAMLATQITYPDDLVDNLRRPVYALFMRIPFSTPDELASIRDDITQIEGGIYDKYFDAALATWDCAVTGIKEILTPNAPPEGWNDRFDAQWRHYIETYFRPISAAMDLSMKLNTAPTEFQYVLPEKIAQQLGPNMMIASYQGLWQLLFQTMATEYPAYFPSPDDSLLAEAMTRLIDHAQVAAKIANELPTFPRELGENTISHFIKYLDLLVTTQTPEFNIQADLKHFADSVGLQNDLFTRYPTGQRPGFPALVLVRGAASSGINSFVQQMSSLCVSRGDRLTFAALVRDVQGFVLSGHLRTITHEQIKECIKEFLRSNNREDLLTSPVLQNAFQDIVLIDNYIHSKIEESHMLEEYVETWQREIGAMREIAATMTSGTKEHQGVLDFIKSSKWFFLMYFVFKYEPSGGMV